MPFPFPAGFEDDDGVREPTDCPECGVSWRPGHACDPPARVVERRHPNGLLVLKGEKQGSPWRVLRRWRVLSGERRER